MTIRKMIISLLEEDEFTLRELGATLGLEESQVLHHMPHISRSVAPARRIRVRPAQCLNCDFTFAKRGRFSTPGKCPKCRSSRITPPTFTIQDTQSKGKRD